MRCCGWICLGSLCLWLCFALLTCLFDVLMVLLIVGYLIIVSFEVQRFLLCWLSGFAWFVWYCLG